METAQEREVMQLLQGRQAWPFHMMGGMSTTAGGCFDGYGGGGSGIGGDCFVLGWEQQPPPVPFGCFGLLAADVHDLFPLFAGMESPLPVSSTELAAPPPVPSHDAVAAIPGDLDDLLLVHDDGDDPLSSIFCTGPTPLPAENAVAFQAPAAAEAEPLLSSSSSNCGDAGGARARAQEQGAAATPTRTPPLPRSSTSTTPSLKRATREESSAEQAAAECSQSESSKRRRTEAALAPSVGVLCPFALLKPDGLDGGATLADINARILMRPSRPVRHPVGEFACAPRVSADQPGISGKAVSSFTRLHTPGRGTITIIRTRD
ncbi:hypothetical protein BAE44_0012382 [Dichanthelium oligosanthes]|uniref:Protein XRI1 n=1 Tax=Dichanthelium oligosanthes TaxID=888268 RepID=A0A1E5VNA2_9POAL|nr:hypothetical protein BAE44_0012382 [Dichanthelium oligosanthes]